MAIPRKYVEAAALFFVLECVAACERSEPERGASSAAVHQPETPKRVETAASAAAPSGANRCVVPLAPDPPPHASRAPSCPKDPTGPPNLPHGWVTFPDAPGQPRVAIEIADNSANRERGLMYRKEMPEDQGMIFSWTDEGERSFWMHDTCIPLDMLYIGADDVIQGVLEEVPAMDETPRAVPCPTLHVLEVNAGWTRAHGIKPGQRVRIES